MEASGSSPVGMGTCCMLAWAHVRQSVKSHTKHVKRLKPSFCAGSREREIKIVAIKFSLARISGLIDLGDHKLGFDRIDF